MMFHSERRNASEDSESSYSTTLVDNYDLDHRLGGTTEMRRVTMMLAAMALMVALFAAVAYAATIDGTNQAEIIRETNLSDTINARGGADEIDATEFSDDTDRANGNAGNDEIDVRDGDGRDTANGGNGDDDVCFIDPNDDDVNCEETIVGSGEPGGGPV